MTGEQFRQELKAAGYTQGRFADLMEVHRQLIGRQCKAKRVEPHWVYALIGLVAATSAQSVVRIVAQCDALPG